jgi:enamine deaminase RidA (YjgF/YER057c/UK114 family)
MLVTPGPDEELIVMERTQVASEPAGVSHVHGEVFGDLRPASTMLVVASLPRWVVEVELDAVIGPG